MYYFRYYFTAERKRPLCAVYAHGGLFCIPRYPRLLFFFLLVIAFHLGSSLSPSTMTGGTCHQIGAVAPWRRILHFLLCFQPKQQTAFTTFLSVPLLGFEEPCFFEVTDSAADGGGRELEV